jgi:hypothetical protein
MRFRKYLEGSSVITSMDPTASNYGVSQGSVMWFTEGQNILQTDKIRSSDAINLFHELSHAHDKARMKVKCSSVLLLIKNPKFGLVIVRI